MHIHNPCANSTFNNNEEIRVPTQQQDLIVLLCESYLYVEEIIVEDGKEGKGGVEEYVGMDNNCVALMFDEIRYEINGVEIDRAKNVGITFILKSYASTTSDNAKIMCLAGWMIPNHMNYKRQV